MCVRTQGFISENSHAVHPAVRAAGVVVSLALIGLVLVEGPTQHVSRAEYTTLGQAVVLTVFVSPVVLLILALRLAITKTQGLGEIRMVTAALFGCTSVLLFIWNRAFIDTPTVAVQSIWAIAGLWLVILHYEARRRT